MNSNKISQLQYLLKSMILVTTGIAGVMLFSSCEKQIVKKKVIIEKEVEKTAEDKAWETISQSRRVALKNKNYEAAIEQAKKFMSNYPNSKYANDAQDILGYMVKRDTALKKVADAKQKQIIVQIMNKLTEEAQVLIDNEEFIKAKELLENYNGELIEETKEARLKEIAKIEGYIKEAAREEARLKEIAEQNKFNPAEVYQEIAEDIIKRKSLSKLIEFTKSENKDKCPELISLLNDLKKIKPTMAEYFSNRKGKEAILTIKGTEKTIKIVSADESNITAELQLENHTLKTKVSYKDLSIRDQIKSLSALPTSSVAVYGLYKCAKCDNNKLFKVFCSKTDFLEPHFTPLMPNITVKDVNLKKTENTTLKSSTEEIAVDKERLHNKLKLTPTVMKMRLNRARNGSMDYDDDGDSIRFNAKLANGNRTFDISDYTISMYILSKSVKDSKVFHISAMHTEKVDVQAMKDVKTQENFIDVVYDKRNSLWYGYKYYGYLAVLESDEGEVVSLVSKSSFVKTHYKEIAKLSTNSNFSANSSGFRIVNGVD